MSRGWYLLLILIILAAAGVLRFWALELRPIHTDEAVNAYRSAEFIQKGWYQYNPSEFHGPMLHYCCMVFCRILGVADYAAFTATTIRSIQALIGILLCGMPFLFYGSFDKKSALFSMVLLAFSPAFVYYSRYYIHELLFVFLGAGFLGFLWRYCISGGLIWAVLAGLFAGMLHATKETCIFVYIAVIAAVAGTYLIYAKRSDKTIYRPKVFHIGILVLTAIFTSAIFFSSIGQNWQAVLDSYKTFFISTQRAVGTQAHTYPWYYYLDLLTWLEFFEKQPWNEDILVVLSGLGLVLAFRSNTMQSAPMRLVLRYIAVYTLAAVILYSVVPYKTPWNVLTMLYGMALCSGAAASWLWRQSPKMASVVLILFGLLSPLVQSYWLNFRIPADPANPYVYAHTSPEFLEMNDEVQAVIQALGDGQDFSIYVVDDKKDYWPWPWYLRRFERAGYWSQIDDSIISAAMVLAPLRMEEKILEKLYELPPAGQKSLYIPVFEKPMALRTGVFWQGYIRKDFYDLYIEKTSPKTSQSTNGNTIMNIDVSSVQKPIRFSSEAMATVFELYLCHPDAKYTAGAAKAAFEKLSIIENELSRYIENSDISRINHLQPGQSAIVSPDTMECLVISKEMYQTTEGTFDPTIGKMTAASGEDIPAGFISGMNNLVLDKDNLTVSIKNSVVSLDLGAIGKGFAVDKMAQVLREWGITKAMLNAGASTILVMDPPAGQDGWQVVIRHPLDYENVIDTIVLVNQAVSCSSVALRPHIINPKTGKAVQDTLACWVIGLDGSTCDAASTACMSLDADTIGDLCRKKIVHNVIICTKSNQILSFGE